MNHTTISLKSIHNPSLFCCIFHVVQFSYMYAQQHLTKHAWIHDDTIPVECHLGLENIPAGTEEEYSLKKSLLYDKANPKTQYSCLWIPFNPLCASTPAQTTFRILADQNAEPLKTFQYHRSTMVLIILKRKKKFEIINKCGIPTLDCTK